MISPGKKVHLKHFFFVSLLLNQVVLHYRTIPTEISSISKLKELNLSNQQRGLVGTIPDEIVQLLHLNLLDLGGNQLSETIPWLIGNMERLTKLNLSNNIFSHSIPSELGRLQGECWHRS